MAASARFGAMLSGADREIVETLTKFGEKIGITFQLADDIIDISSDAAQSGKVPGADIREGIPTLVTIQIMASSRTEDQELKSLLSAPMDDVTVTKVISQLRKHHALNDAKKYLHALAEESKAILSSLPPSPARNALESICGAIVTRTA